MTNACVYWIGSDNSQDIFKSGYIGVSKDLKKRLSAHENNPSNYRLKNAINEYGWNNLIKKVILIADKDYCIEMEKKLRPSGGIGWNLMAGGGNPPLVKTNKHMIGKTPWNKGVKMSEKSKKKLSNSLKGKIAWNKGTKGVMVAWNKGTETPEEVRIKQSLAKKGKPSVRLGMKHSPEAIEKMKLAHKGVIVSEETRAKLSLASKGRKFGIITCPHCGKSGGETGMKSWHFDNCKSREAA